MFFLAIVSLLWAFSFGLIGNTLSGVDSFFVATFRLGCATLLFLPFLRIKETICYDRLRLMLIGAIQFGLMYTCYMSAFKYLPSHLIAIFSILTPLYVVLIHNLRQRNFCFRYFVAAFFSIAGAFVIKAESLPTGDFWRGFGLMQVAGICFAYGQVAYRDWKKENPKTNDRSVFAWLTIGGVLCVGFFSLFFTNWEKLELIRVQWYSILYLGFVASGLGFFLWNKGASKSNPGTLAAFNNVVVPAAVVISLFFFGEAKSLNVEVISKLFIGSFLIATSVVMGRNQSAKS